MKRLLILATAISFSAPALAQHQGHTMPMPASKAQPKAKPAPKAAPRKPAVKAPARPAPKPAPKALAKPAADPHAGHRMEAAPPTKPAADPHAGHQSQQAPREEPPVQEQVDPHSGHQMEPPADPHAGHDMGAMPAQQATDPRAGREMGEMEAQDAPPVAPPPPEAFQGPENAAETIYDPQLFRRKRQEELIDEHGGFVTWMFLADQLEYRLRDSRDGYKWDAQGWYGGDYDKFWIKTEGEGGFGEAPEQAEVQALYSRSIDPWFNLQAGVRHDLRPDPERTHLVVGIQGLARYWFEVDGALFLSDKGDFTARFEAEYDQRITQKLILQPAVEFNLSAQDVPEVGIGSGLTSIEAGLRLRYEVVPEFAPYIGVEYERAFGDTARFARAAGEDVGGWSFLIGIRAWF